MIDFKLGKAAEFHHHCFSAHNVGVRGPVDVNYTRFLLRELKFSLDLNYLRLKVWQTLTDLAVFVTHALHFVPQR